MKFKRIAAGILSLSILLPMISVTGCKKKDSADVKIEADTPWYESTITTVDTGLNPADFLFYVPGVMGMAGDKIVFFDGGSLIWDPYDFSSTENTVNQISVCDSDGNYLYTKNLKEVAGDFFPNAESLDIKTSTITGDYIRLVVDRYENATYHKDTLLFDPTTQETISEASVSEDDSSFELGAYSVDGYSIMSKMTFYDLDNVYTLEVTSDTVDRVYNITDVFPYDYIVAIQKLIYLGDSKFCIQVNMYDLDDRFCYIDLNTDTICDLKDVSDYSWIYDLKGAYDYDYCEGVGNIRASQHGIMLLDLENKTETKYVDYDSCNINRHDASQLSILSATEDKIVLAGITRRENFSMFKAQDISEYIPLVVILQKADTNPNAGKGVITAASFDPISYAMAEAIRQFNESDNGGFIVLDPRYDYNTVAASVIRDPEMTDSEYDLEVKSAMMSLLSIDLLAGDGPDLILGAMNYTHLNKEELLLDLSEDVEVQNVYENIMEFAKTGDKLYQVPLAFGLEGTLAYSDSVDTSVPGFTFESYREYVSGPCNGRDPNRMAKLDFLSTCLAEMSVTFRTEDGFDLNNDEFAQVAAFVKDLILPTEDELLEEEMYYLSNTWAPEPEFVNITSGMELLKVTHNDINDRVVMGFPSIEPMGLMVNVSQSVGVSAVTKSPTACKSFVNMLVGEDFQTLFATYDGISVNSAAQEAACRAFAERTNYAFEAISAVWNIQDIKQLQVFDTTVDADEFVTQMDGYIRNASGIHMTDAAVDIIVREEIQAYFVDQKTIEDVMGIIQNRVDTYVSEVG